MACRQLLIAIAAKRNAAAGAGTRPGELWRYSSPYRGLSAMKEKDADYFSFHNDGIISAPHLADGCSFIRGRSGSSGLIVTVTGGHPPAPGVSHAVAKATARRAGFMSCIELR